MSRTSPFRFGVYHPRGIESTFCVTPVFRYHRDGVIEFCDTERGRVLAEIFQGMGHIRFVDKPITIEEAFARYGNPRRQVHTDHICKMHVDAMAMGHNNYIPWMTFTLAELMAAKRFCGQFRSPICINPIAGGAVQDPNGGHETRMLPIHSWERIIDALKDQHDFIYFTKEDNYIPIRGTHPVFHLSLRQMCAVYKIAQIVLSIDNGLYHGAIAAGARVHCFVPMDQRKYYAPNFVYTPDMWWDEPKRVEYYSYSGVDGLIRELGGTTTTLEHNLLTAGRQAL